jgi:crotonobetainyl-CoA:carnitine CoA-transferase CaiB-like acyl-CoA transferase
MTIGAANDRNFVKVARVLGHDEWLTDARFSGNTQRIAHRDELARLIEEETVKQPVVFWLSAFEQAGIPCGPILDYEDAFIV